MARLSYNVNGAYTWVIVNGLVDGNNIVYTIDYTGLNPTYYVNANGTISSATFMSGNANAPGQTGTWDATGTAIEIDPDNDSVPYTEDKCLGTVADNPTEGLGVNRHILKVLGNESFTTLVPAGKGTKIEAQSAFSLADTYGCSCEQILQELKNAAGVQMNGHWKFGCSKSVMEEWVLDMNDGVLDGMYLVETIAVPANKATETLSTETLIAGQEFILKAYGTGTACNQPGCHITFDAEYSTSDGGLNWVDGVAAPYTSYGPNLLDLKVDNTFIDWGAYNALNIYQISYTGTGNPLSLLVYDIAGSYFNDAGTIYVDVFAQV